ncbi:MAG: nitrilase-related carbon-nitrogen hydrolase [Dehalococcoidia bacterium]
MKAFRVALCQVRAHDLEDAEANLQNLLRSLDEAGETGAQLVGLPESSYPAYYLRDASPYARPGVRPFDEVCELLAGKAKKYGYWLAAGIAAPGRDGKLTNSALVFGPDGSTHGQFDKSFLWHFDSTWFTAGTEFPVWDMGFAKVGILICADGRMPEIARSLALNGAEVILDLTAWVSAARETSQLSNPQCEYFMPVRAAENGVWVAAGDKWGFEAGSIVYAGRSMVISPSGETVAIAPSDAEAVLVYDLAPMTPDLVPRRPALYRSLTRETSSLPISEVLAEPLTPSDLVHGVSVVPSNGGFDVRKIAATYRELRAQGAELVVFGGEDGPEGWQVELSTLEAAVRELGGAMVVGVATTGCSAHQSTVLITPEATTEHAATHGRGIQLGELPSPVLTTPAGNVGLLCGEEGFVPEVARGLMLAGADILAWPLFRDHPMLDRLIRTRADENRVYTAAAWHDGGMVASPTGAVATVVLRGSGVAMTAQVNKALSRSKEMAPGTNVVTNRQPAAYGALVR